MNWSVRRSLALSSLLALALAGAVRPRYGGVLRIQTPEIPAFESNPAVVETLVRFDERGELQPMLARSWQREADGHRWRFWLRPRVSMHDGTPLTAAVVAGLVGSGATAAAGNQVVLASDSLVPPLTPVFRRSSEGLIGTGPFRLARLEPGRRAILTAFEEHWAGRPFLDSVEFSTQRGSPAEVLWLPVSASRRSIPERMTVWISPLNDVLVLSVPPALREIFALAIDREAIANVITQRRGEPARALLPDWLTGYAAALPLEHDKERARQMVAAAKPGPLMLAIDGADALMKLVGDRIALNLQEAGLTVRAGAQQGAAKLLRLRLPSNNAAQSLAAFAQALGLPAPSALGSPQAVYDAERALIADTLVPVVHVPEIYAIDPRVHNWDPGRLAMVWMGS